MNRLFYLILFFSDYIKVFDAADVLKLGRDLIVQHGLTTNRKGIEWLRRHTKSRGYRVHEIHFPDDLLPIHIGEILRHTKSRRH